MYPIILVVKRIPDDSVWQRYRAYRLPDVEGVARAYLPGGTRWWNPLGGWVTPRDGVGVAVFPQRQPFTISCYGAAGSKRFYIDIIRSSIVSDEVIEYLDLYLDVMIDPAGVVTEKDEEQLERLDDATQTFVRSARDEVRARIAAGDPLFDPGSAYYALPPGSAALGPVPD